MARRSIVKNLNITGRFGSTLNGTIVSISSRGTINNLNTNIIAKCDYANVLKALDSNDKSSVIKNSHVEAKLINIYRENFKDAKLLVSI